MKYDILFKNLVSVRCELIVYCVVFFSFYLIMHTVTSCVSILLAVRKRKHYKDMTFSLIHAQGGTGHQDLEGNLLYIYVNAGC